MASRKLSPPTPSTGRKSSTSAPAKPARVRRLPSLDAQPVDGELPKDAVMVAHVLGAWGVKGAIKVAPASADADALRMARHWWIAGDTRRLLQPPKTARMQRVTSVRWQGDALVAELAGLQDRNAAEALTGSSIWIPRSEFPATDNDEYYWVDLIGCTVVNHAGHTLGSVAGLMDTGAHSVLRVQRDTSASSEEQLIPFVGAYVGRVDLKARRIEVNWEEDFDA